MLPNSQSRAGQRIIHLLGGNQTNEATHCFAVFHVLPGGGAFTGANHYRRRDVHFRVRERDLRYFSNVEAGHRFGNVYGRVPGERLGDL